MRGERDWERGKGGMMKKEEERRGKKDGGEERGKRWGDREWSFRE